MAAISISTTNPPGVVPTPAGRSIISRLIGAVLVLPAISWGLLTITLPAGAMFYLSLLKSNLSGPAEFVGLENYQQLASIPSIGSALTETLLIVAMAILLAGFTAAFIVLGAAWLGKKSIWLARLLFCLPLAAWVPLFWGISWTSGFSSYSLIGGLLNPVAGQPLFSAGAAPWVVALVVGLIVFGPASALSGFFYLGAARKQNSTRRLWVLFGLIWVTTILAILAVLSQDWALSDALPGSALVTTLGSEIYKLTFMYFQIGQGAALSVLLGILATLIGLVVTVIIVASGLEIRLAGGESRPEPKKLPGFILLLVGLVCFVVLSVLGLLPAISAAFAKPSVPAPDLPSSLISTGLGNSLLQLIPIFVLQLPITYLAALGIGGLRPLGKRSEWLLLLFGGGLFLTSTTMSVAGFKLLQLTDGINTLWGLLLSGLALNVPMLFVLTLFFKGQHTAWKDRMACGESDIRAAFKAMLLPSLPLAFFLALVASVITLGDFIWPMIAVSSQEMMPLSLRFLIQHQTTMGSGGVFSGMLVPVLVQFGISLVALVLFQVFYLRRLEVR